MKSKLITKIISIGLAFTGGLFVSGASVDAKPLGASGLLSVFDSSWTQFQAQGAKEDGRVGRGKGARQKFDAEYLLYKMEGNTLSIGLQAGFNLERGITRAAGVRYFAGDLALSFNGNAASSYEYAVDFGLRTKDADGDRVGARRNNARDAAGVYRKIGWNTDIPTEFIESNPFAMDKGRIIDGALLDNSSGHGSSTDDITSYYRIVTLDLSRILGDNWQEFLLETHWTMSNGRDDINGTVSIAPVPEPKTMFLFGTGLIGLSTLLRKRTKRNNNL